MTRFLDLARSRYSCRSYDSRPVEKEKLDLILKAGRIAPSACNLQPWHFFVIEGSGLEMIHQVYPRDWFRSAPCVIVICGDHRASWKRSDRKDHCDVDVAIATDHMTLQATELELATCWICAFDAKKTSVLMKLPSHLEPIVLLPVGYPLDKGDPGRHSKLRKPLSESVTYGI